MKTKKPDPSAKPQVTVTRPVATVTISIKGTVHTVTEEEARELHTSLGKALNIQPEVIWRDRSKDQYDQPFRPWPYPIPQLKPLAPHENPRLPEIWRSTFEAYEQLRKTLP